MTSISNIGIQLQAIANLNSQQSSLASLNEQLASGTLHDNLTDYDPTTAKNLMDFQNSVTQNQAYIAGMNTVSSRLTLYNSTMTDMESIASQAQELASSNQTQDPTKTAQLQSEATNYLKQLTDDLNQQIGGRYIYAGTRYDTPPVSDLSATTTAPYDPTTSTFTAATSPALPTYDSQYSALTVNSAAPTGNVRIGGTSIAWSQIASGNVTSVTVNGTTKSVTVTGLTSPATDASDAAANLQSVINQLSSQLPDLSGLTATASGANVAITSASATQNSTLTIGSTPTGAFQVGNASVNWSDIAAGTISSVSVNGSSTAVTPVTLPNVPATTPAQIAANTQSAINQLSSQVTAFSGLSASASGAVVSISSAPGTGTITPDLGGVATETTFVAGTPGLSIMPDSGGTSGEVTWSSGTDGTSAQIVGASAGAYTKDSVAIDSATSITYGVTSNDPSIQKLIAGLQFMNAATQPNVDAATYKSYMAQAASLLTTALGGVQGLNSSIASDQNIIAGETSTQNADITNLQNQLSNLQEVNITQVGTEIDTLQTQLQASYSATASLTQLSLLKYL